MFIYVARIIFKKNRGGILILPDFKSHYKATVIKTMWHQRKDESKKKTTLRQNRI